MEGAYGPRFRFHPASGPGRGSHPLAVAVTNARRSRQATAAGKAYTGGVRRRRERRNGRGALGMVASAAGQADFEWREDEEGGPRWEL